MLGDEAVDMDRAGLANPVSSVAIFSCLVNKEKREKRGSPVLALPVHRGIVVAIIENHSICTSQAAHILSVRSLVQCTFDLLDSNSARSRRGDKGKDPRVHIESFSDHLSLLDLGGTVEPEISVSV